MNISSTMHGLHTVSDPYIVISFVSWGSGTDDPFLYNLFCGFMYIFMLNSILNSSSPHCAPREEI